LGASEKRFVKKKQKPGKKSSSPQFLGVQAGGVGHEATLKPKNRSTGSRGPTGGKKARAPPSEKKNREQNNLLKNKSKREATKICASIKGV